MRVNYRCHHFAGVLASEIAIKDVLAFITVSNFYLLKDFKVLFNNIQQ